MARRRAAEGHAVQCGALWKRGDAPYLAEQVGAGEVGVS